MFFSIKERTVHYWAFRLSATLNLSADKLSCNFNIRIVAYSDTFFVARQLKMAEANGSILLAIEGHWCFFVKIHKFSINEY